MEGVWRKAKKAMGVGLCVHLPAVAGDREGGASERRASDAVSLDSAAAAHGHGGGQRHPRAAEVQVRWQVLQGETFSSPPLCEQVSPVISS